MRHLAILACALAMALLAGCAQYVAVDPGKAREIGGVFRVDPQVGWSAFKQGNREVWTVNGSNLEAVSFVTKIEDGEPLAASTVGKKDDAPTYRAGMRAPDVVDFFQATLMWMEYSQIETTDLRPTAIGEATGFRFDYSAFNGNGLAKRGIVVGLIDAKDGLSLIVYEAAAEHYFDEYLDEAEGVLASARRL